MTDQNDSMYSPSPNEPGYFESHSTPNDHPASPRRNRYTRQSMASWNSRDFRPVSVLTQGMMSPRAPSSVGSRPLPVPSQPLAAFETLPPYHAPSSPEVDATPRPYIMSQPSGFQDDRDWEPEEAMTIGQSDAYSYVDHTAQPDEMAPESETYGRQVISLDDPDAPPVVVLDPEPSTKPLGITKRFVGGFVASLRRLPKAVTKSSLYDRKATRKGAPGTVHSTGRSHFVLAPGFEEPSVTADHTHLSSVDGAQPSALQDVPTDMSYAGELSGRTSRPHSARRASSNVQSQSISPSTPRFLPEGAILADPELASDYVKMEAPAGPPDDSFSAHITRVTNFIQELKNLPWVSDRVAVDYRPMRSSRACVGKAKESGSWYNRKQDVDLLAGGPASPRTHAARMRSHSGPSSRASMNSAAATRTYHRHHHPDRTPLSFMTSPLSMPSPGASSHGQGQHPMSCSYYFAPPQPLYVYTPSSHLQSVAEGTPGPSPPMSQVAQALPVYMIPGPPPRMFQSPVPASPSAQRSHARPTSPTRTSGVPPSATQRSSHSRHSGSNAH